MWLNDYMGASLRLLHVGMLIFVWKVLCSVPSVHNTNTSTRIQETVCYTLHSRVPAVPLYALYTLL